MRRILNNAISLIVVVIVLFLVIPLHPSVLDVLLILNISLSIMILMITMNISEPLEFFHFSLPAAHYDSIPAGIKCVLHPSDPQKRGKRRCGH